MSVKRLATAVFASILLLASQTARAATLDVDDDRAQQPSAPWTSIGQALGVAQRGDTVRVFPGTYNEQVVITQDINLIAFPLIGEPVIIQPLALPESRLSVLQYTVPVTAGILVDGATVIVEGFQLDMSQNGMATCSPLLTGVYMRNASGSVRKMMISGTSIPADPTCDSGVAVYVESGKAGEVFGEPFFGSAHVRLIENTYLGYQKAGMVANGRYTVVSDRGDQALGLGSTGGAVQYGFQVGASAKGRFRKIMARDHTSTVAGRTAAGLLVYRTSRAKLGQAQFFDSQTGMFVVGDHAAAFTTGFQNMSVGSPGTELEFAL